VYRFEEARPVGFTHGLKHFDRGDRVERLVPDVAVVLQAHVALCAHAGALQPFLRPGQLFRG